MHNAYIILYILFVDARSLKQHVVVGSLGLADAQPQTPVPVAVVTWQFGPCHYLALALARLSLRGGTDDMWRGAMPMGFFSLLTRNKPFFPLSLRLSLRQRNKQFPPL